MIPNKKLIQALRTVADAIENNDFYDKNEDFYTTWDWNNPHQCNCGLLARELGVTINDILENVTYGYWSSSLEKALDEQDLNIKQCSSTNIPLNKVFDTLFQNGIQPQDIREIEFCSGAISLDENEDRLITCNYFRDQANLLEHQLNSKENLNDVVTVSC